MTKHLNEEKSKIKRLHKVLCRIIPAYKRSVANHKGREHHEKFGHIIRTEGSDKIAMRHRSASLRFRRIRDGKHPFKRMNESLMDFLKPKPKTIARIKAKHHDRVATKLVDGKDDKKYLFHDRAARRYQRIADGKKPFGEENE